MQQFKEMAISQINGFIQQDPYDPTITITGYIYKLDFNKQFREYVLAQ